MKMMIDTAKATDGTQFVLISPLDMGAFSLTIFPCAELILSFAGGIKTGPEVRVIRLADPGRNQGSSSRPLASLRRHRAQRSPLAQARSTWAEELFLWGCVSLFSLHRDTFVFPREHLEGLKRAKRGAKVRKSAEALS